MEGEGDVGAGGQGEHDRQAVRVYIVKGGDFGELIEMTGDEASLEWGQDGSVEREGELSG